MEESILRIRLTRKVGHYPGRVEGSGILVVRVRSGEDPGAGVDFGLDGLGCTRIRGGGGRGGGASHLVLSGGHVGRGEGEAKVNVEGTKDTLGPKFVQSQSGREESSFLYRLVTRAYPESSSRDPVLSFR